MQLCQLINCHCSTLAHDHELSHAHYQIARLYRTFPYKAQIPSAMQLQQQSIVNYKRNIEIAKYGEHMPIYIISVLV